MSEPRVIKREQAVRDLEDVSDYIRGDSPRAALRFLEAAERTFVLLAGQPGMGALYQTEDPGLVGLCRFPVSGFRNYLIFYLPIGGGIEVLAVVHGGRDIPSLLARTM